MFELFDEMFEVCWMSFVLGVEFFFFYELRFVNFSVEFEILFRVFHIFLYGTGQITGRFELRVRGDCRE